MRLLLTVCFLMTLLCVGLTQVSPQNLFMTVKPEATFRIQKHKMGADLVEITLLDSQYPQDVLRDQIRRLGAELQSEPRGVAIGRVSMTPNDPGGTYLRATFAVDGLTDPSTGVFRIGPLARSMTGAPKGHEIHGIAIVFEKQVPGESTIEEYGLQPGSPVAVLGKYSPGPIGLEYRVLLNTQDPTKINIPDRKIVASAPAAKAVPAPQATPWFLYVSIVLFALAFGALVYSVTLRNSGPRPPSASKNQSIGTPRHR